MLLLKDTLTKARTNPVLSKHVKKVDMKETIIRLQHMISVSERAQSLLESLNISPRNVPVRTATRVPATARPTLPTRAHLSRTQPRPLQCHTAARDQDFIVIDEDCLVDGDAEFQPQSENRIECSPNRAEERPAPRKRAPRKYIPPSSEDIYLLAHHLASLSGRPRWGRKDQLDWAGFARKNPKRCRRSWRNWYVGQPQRRKTIDALVEKYKRELKDEMPGERELPIELL
ncbi:hypothetical protein DACRYDRAFT_15923 [Dacryopinax primogenitus]|uniref:Uncharacterized protein n=1 Tax=Dacryopinax primogenitus (strain DJM 731) TaxID=1858805 RepID=M5FZM4_DACPD|nr:uncharacterized protein DACRYDRAFT_15923 [Dacryopinax primogenitus]EJU01964.1 hypothetical protein DACRYDRAFT_15923 [Dacryopinax primogenitus]